ncbi:transglutaminase domain-containing protein [Streptomyces sp. AC550_RSS872]|uniref:transglutaminase domain-containing protein n=1 Tax=Streptomyces sp. AC550_RSS872 TaxID=2823689 RepID=UPI001C26F808|nr:transglutaminase domain-containing protein [Streptomyces sp. AC550_RSS872]
MGNEAAWRTVMFDEQYLTMEGEFAVRPAINAAEAVQKLLRIPSAYRQFSVGADIAHKQYGVNEELLEELLDLGLPHTGSSTKITFDPLDLENLSIDLRLPTVYWRSNRWWSKYLGEVKQSAGGLELRFTATCPQPGHEGDCAFTLIPRPEGASLTPPQRHGDSAVFCIRVDSPVGFHDFGNSIDPVIAEARTLEFHKFRKDLSYDTGFVRETRLANCLSAAFYLVEVACNNGLVARPAAGLLMAPPLSAWHAWIEFPIDGSWTAADPFFLNTLQCWGVIDPVEWPLSVSPGPAFFHLDATDSLNSPLVLHGNIPADCSMTVSRQGSPVLAVGPKRLGWM